MAAKRPRFGAGAEASLETSLDVSPNELLSWLAVDPDNLGGAAPNTWAAQNSEVGPVRMVASPVLQADRSELAFIAGLLADDDDPKVVGGSPAPPHASDGSISFPTAVEEEEIAVLLSSLPKQYKLGTTRVDQLLHARLLRRLRAEDAPVLTSWVRSKSAVGGESLLQLHIVFRDRPGSLGTLSTVLSQAGANIVGVAAFTTTDGFAVDVIGIDSGLDEVKRAPRRTPLPPFVSRRLRSAPAPCPPP